MKCERCDHDASAPVLAAWTMVFYLPVPSANLRQHQGKAGYAYRTLRDKWTSAAKVMRINAEMPVATEKRRVLVTRCYKSPSREYDPDNLVAGCKAIIDSLVRGGVLLSDSRRWAEISYRQERATVDCVTVLVEEVASGPA